MRKKIILGIVALSLCKMETVAFSESKYQGNNITFFNNNIILATAAYNAGPGNVRKWLSARPMPADIWIETIPFRETRTYVKNIMGSMTFYEKELNISNTLSSRMRNAVWAKS